jgi:DNA modification methylase
MINLYKGDCLIESDKIESGSVDLILTDLPYGNMKNAPSTWDKSKTYWDTTIDPKKVFEIANRILRKNGKMILFSQEPYTTKLITEAIPNVPFSYRGVWEKDNFANALGVNKSWVSFTEDVLIFSKNHPKHDFEGKHPLRDYAKRIAININKSRAERKRLLGHRGSDHFLEVIKNPLQFGLCTEKTYLELIEVFGIDKLNGFNLWEGNKYKSNVLKYKKDYTGHHPTQKPILLLEDLIKTFSNENDLVVDLTMGSGSTGVACVNTNRNFIGIEKDDNYFEIAEQRIKDQQRKNEEELFRNL